MFDIMSAFRQVVFTREGDVRYVNDMMCPTTRASCKELRERWGDDIEDVSTVPDGWVLLVTGKQRDGTIQMWVSTEQLVLISQVEGWTRRDPPEGEFEGVTGMWDGNGEWMNFQEASRDEEMPPEI